MATQAKKAICPACGKKGLGVVFPHLTGSYRQCQYCSETVPVASAPVSEPAAVMTLIGRTFQCGTQRATVLKMGRTLATVRLNDGSVGKVEASLFSAPHWAEV